MARKKLEGEALTNYTNRVRAEISREAERLGFDAVNVLRAVSEFGQSEARLESMAWAIGVTLGVILIRNADSSLGFVAECAISWSAAERSVSQAVHAISLYQRAVEMASIIEGVVR